MNSTSSNPSKTEEQRFAERMDAHFKPAKEGKKSMFSQRIEEIEKELVKKGKLPVPITKED